MCINKNLIRSFVLLIALTKVFSVYAGMGIVPAAPKINASSYLLMDFDSGQVLAQENIDQPLPPASLTKMMTVYVAANELQEGRIHLNDKTVVSKKAWRMPGSRMFIEVNKEVVVEDLLKGIIIQSGNDASVALAEYISGSEEVFAELMNQHAKRLGMNHTHYANSTGLPDENHYTTAQDLATMATALIRDFPKFYKWHSIKEYTYNKIKQTNRNNLLWRDATVDGIKTGHTEEAGFCLVASAKRENMRLVSVVMGTDGAEARIKASQALLNYGFRFYETHRLYSSQEVIANVRIWKGETEHVDVGLHEELYITIPKGQYNNLNASVEMEDKIIAPVAAGDKLGKLLLTLAGREVLDKPLIALDNVKQGSLFSRIRDDVKLLFE